MVAIERSNQAFELIQVESIVEILIFEKYLFQSGRKSIFKAHLKIVPLNSFQNVFDLYFYSRRPVSRCFVSFLRYLGVIFDSYHKIVFLIFYHFLAWVSFKKR